MHGLGGQKQYTVYGLLSLPIEKQSSVLTQGSHCCVLNLSKPYWKLHKVCVIHFMVHRPNQSSCGSVNNVLCLCVASDVVYILYPHCVSQL